MFTTANIRFHIAKASLRTEELTKDERSPVMAVALVLEPLTRDLALELGAHIADHCFTREGTIREEIRNCRFAIRERPHALTVKMATDAEPHCVLRHARITTLTINARGMPADDREPTKGKKIGPQAVTLRATLSCLVDPAETAHREFFCRYIHDFMLFTFEPEQADLFAARVDDTSDDEEDGARLPLDTEAGDVLDEQAAQDQVCAASTRKKGRPRLVKGAVGEAPPTVN